MVDEPKTKTTFNATNSQQAMSSNDAAEAHSQRVVLPFCRSSDSTESAMSFSITHGDEKKGGSRSETPMETQSFVTVSEPSPWSWQAQPETFAQHPMHEATKTSPEQAFGRMFAGGHRTDNTGSQNLFALGSQHNGGGFPPVLGPSNLSVPFPGTALPTTGSTTGPQWPDFGKPEWSWVDYNRMFSAAMMASSSQPFLATTPPLLSSARNQDEPEKQLPSGQTRRPKKPRNRRYSHDSKKSKVYVEPNEFDVLMGRGSRSNRHPGNQRYLQEIKLLWSDAYSKCSKKQKTILTKQIVQHVRDYGGRFIQLDTSNGLWYIASDAVARKKASQALREAVKSKNDQL